MEPKNWLVLNRLRVLRRGEVAYDQQFHEGVNIIRGQNGSGKSSISDFIFFVLGGEFDAWKNAASKCDQVQAEINTPNGVLTLRRDTDSKTEPVYVFFGTMEKANQQSLDSWEKFYLRRRENDISFSQLMFKSIGIPEAQSEGASNITMHQLIRLIYSDQKTPSSRLFRFESFDTQNIREAVGDLVCGISGYDLYENSLELRDLNTSLAKLNTKLNGLQKALPRDEALMTSAAITTRISDLSAEKSQFEKSLDDLDQLENDQETDDFVKTMKASKKALDRERSSLNQAEEEIAILEYEIKDLESYSSYLNELYGKLELTEKSLGIIGDIEFVYCPACGGALDEKAETDHCGLCKREVSQDEEKSKYNQIRMDLEIQLRESKQLLRQKHLKLKDQKRHVRELTRSHKHNISEYRLKYAGGSGPREKILAEISTNIGRIGAEIENLEKSRSVASEVEKLIEEKNELVLSISIIEKSSEGLKRQSENRRRKALNGISSNVVSLLHSDLGRQDEFKVARKVDINFKNDAVSVDESVNFAESSGVFLKNSVILSLFLAACEDSEFNHPRFALFDNIEDKGMEVERSHLFQRLIVERATEADYPFQVIFTTSMMNPDLEMEDYVIGPAYTEDNKTLNI